MSIIRKCSANTFLLAVLLFMAMVLSPHPPAVSAQATQQPIPATRAFDSPGCSMDGLADTVFAGERTNPEWKVILIDPTVPLPNGPVTILEGIVPPPPENETSDDQAHSEVSEEEVPWNHYTHDFTFKVVPDSKYSNLLSSWVNTDSTVGVHGDMEVEWENASLMDEPEGSQRIWGAAPEFVWPSVGDRVWVEGRWVFDCGHPNADNGDFAHVQFSTEIHPPRALVTFRLNHPALDSFPRLRTSAPNFPAPQSYLPVTGCPLNSDCATPITLPPGVPNSGPTNVPVTEADIFVSGNGGGANDQCMLAPTTSENDCTLMYPHTSAVIPVNDRNYVFDIYPPGTCYGFFDCQLVNGTFPVTLPVPDASLQWRIVDHFDELPAHACGDNEIDTFEQLKKVCKTVDPIICLIDASTPPPDQTETGCPVVPAHPTRLRVILRFAGTDANFFAESILLGWDDVPAPPTTPAVRTFNVSLDNFTVDLGEGDWRVFVNVGGQYRYMSQIFDTDANNGKGIFAFDGGSNMCHGDPLTENDNGDCYAFDNTPWIVSVQDGTPIHVAVGGYESIHLLEGSSFFETKFCRNYPGGCDFSSGTSIEIGIEGLKDFQNPFKRIGSYEFDLVPPDYAAPPAFTTAETTANSGEKQYTVKFRVEEIVPAAAPVSAPLVIGAPNFVGPVGTFIAAPTPITLQTPDPSTEGFQYRFHRQGALLPTYPSLLDFSGPVHWAHVDLVPGSQSATVAIGNTNVGDGPYDFQYSAESFGNLLEPRHTTTAILDTTPPVITIVQPQATPYPHAATLTLNYTVDDGTGSGVASFTPTMDGAATLPGGIGLQSGQPISLLTELSLGTHTFRIDAVDNVGNAASKSVTFTIIVTPDSIKDDVRQFLQSAAIKNAGEANSLLAKLDAAAAKRASGNCSAAANIYQAFINELLGQTGNGVDAAAAAIMIADAQYLIAHCP